MNKKKQKQKIRQKGQMKRGQKRKAREKRVLNAKHTRGKVKKINKKIITQSRKVSNIKDLPLRVKIKFYLRTAYQKFGCFIGMHDWKICSGREGDPMYTCIKCWKRSTKKWEKGGSADYYDKKYEDKLGISVHKNWEKKGNDWYFKGNIIKLDREQRRRLKVILSRKEKNDNKK